MRKRWKRQRFYSLVLAAAMLVGCMMPPQVVSAAEPGTMDVSQADPDAGQADTMDNSRIQKDGFAGSGEGQPSPGKDTGGSAGEGENGPGLDQEQTDISQRGQTDAGQGSLDQDQPDQSQGNVDQDQPGQSQGNLARDQPGQGQGDPALENQGQSGQVPGSEEDAQETDGQITQGKTVYLWYGENKTNNTRPVDGVRCYVSTDLYNWKDRGNVLYLQNVILPVEESDRKAVTSNPGASGVGTTQDYNAMQLSVSNLEQLKAWGRLESAPDGVSEEDFGNAKLFLRAYVTEFEKEPVGLYDTSWTARSYDETPITASSFLYLDSRTEGTVSTIPLQLAFEGLYGNYCITERPVLPGTDT